jgi:hypothetical protein
MELSQKEQLLPDVDAIGLLADLLSVNDIIVLSLVCKHFYIALFKYKFKVEDQKIGPYTLNKAQYLTCLKLQEHLQFSNKGILCAPMGWGKTLTAIYYLQMQIEGKSAQGKRNAVISVPPNVLKVWIDELTKVGLISSKPLESKVLVYHSTRINHKRFKDKNAVDWFTDHRIILTTSNLEYAVKGRVDFVIYDEYHKLECRKDNKYIQAPFAKIIGLTGELGKYKDRKNVVTPGVDHVGKIPSVKFKWWCIENFNDCKYATYEAHIEDFKSFSREYRSALIRCVSSHNKMVISVDKGEIGTLIREWLASDLPTYKQFELATSMRVEYTFNAYKYNAVLFISTSNNEGLNILEENLLIVKPDIMACTRIRQTVARLRRPNNPHKVVEVNYILGGKMALLKSFYASCYADPEWNLNFDDTPNEHFLLKCAGVLGLLGYKTITECPLPDACVIFDHIHTKKRGELVLDWWKKHKSDKSILTCENVEALYS